MMALLLEAATATDLFELAFFIVVLFAAHEYSVLKRLAEIKKLLEKK